MKKEVKSQVALEFLTTYAWAFVVVMIVIGALYYFGVFDFSKFLPKRCMFPSQFECLDYAFIGDEIRFKLVNGVGEDIQINSIVATDDADLSLSCSLVAPNPAVMPYAWDEGIETDFVLNACTGAVFIEGERAEAKVTIKYCAPATTGCPEHTISGIITTTVKAP
jgi:hypothetical protein